MDKQKVQSILFFVVFAAFFILVARLFMPFFSILLWAGIIFVLVNPLYDRLSGERRARLNGKQAPGWRRALSAGFLSIFSVLVIIIPLGGLLFLLAKQGAQTIKDILEFLEKSDNLFSSLFPHTDLPQQVQDLTDGLVNLDKLNVKELISTFLSENQQTLINASTHLVKNIGSFLLSVCFMIFSLYFFFIDGRYLLGLFTKAIPIKGEYMERFVNKFKETSSQLVRGNLAVACIQGLIAFTLFMIFHVKNALLLGVMTSVCSFIPMAGAGIIWLPVSVYYILFRDPFLGVLLLGLAAVGVSLLDNFYRPFLVGGPINIHPLPIFFSIVGGISIFGINGLIIGPLILALFFTALDIFREAYQMPPVIHSPGDAPAAKAPVASSTAQAVEAPATPSPAAAPEKKGE
jgi:predicted PurR-regulated permease PerM